MKFLTMRRTKNANCDTDLKFTIIKGKLYLLKIFFSMTLFLLYCHKGDSCEVPPTLPRFPRMCSIVVTLMKPSDLNPALNFFNLWNF